MTPHISAKKGDIAKNVLMPGDPLRARYIATKYLKNSREVNSIRNMLMYTGTYKDKLVTIAASGMGMPSAGIYSYELFYYYNVEKIIRIGTSGSYTDELKVRDLVLVKEAFSTSTFARDAANYFGDVLTPSSALNKIIIDQANKMKLSLKLERIESEDVFYNILPLEKRISRSQAKCVEMESFALFAIANRLNREAACLLTISDNIATGEEISAFDRQNSLDEMIKLALESL